MKFFYLLLLMSFIGCAEVEMEKNDYPFALKEENTLILPIDNETSYEIYLPFFYEKDTLERLYTWNHFTNGINIYNLKTLKEEPKIKINREGPQSIKSIQGFTVLNEDSIIVYSRGHIFRSLLVNGKGEVIADKVFPKPLEKSLFNHLSNGHAPTVLHKNQVCFIQYPLMDLSDPANINDEFQFEVCYDLATKKRIDKGVTYPESYQGRIWGTFNHLLGRAKGHDNHFVYSWPAEERLFVTDFEGNEQWVYAGIDEGKGKTPRAFANRPNPEEVLTTMVYNYSYRSIYYDKYRKVYYRLALLPMDELKSNDYTAFSYQRFAVIILNEAFEKIGEVLLEKEKFNYESCFVGKEGFYIPQTYPENPKLNENKLIYSIFKLTPNE